MKFLFNMHDQAHQNALHSRMRYDPVEDRRQARILVVEDTELDRILLSEVIGSLGGLTYASTGVEAMDLFLEHDFDLVLLDILLPDMDGFALCRQMRDSHHNPHMPIIFLTSLDDDGSEQQGLVIGASDYITKPFSPPVVRTRVMNQIELYRKTKEVINANEKLMLLAATDDLTGVFNRRQFLNLAEQKIAEAADMAEPTCVMVIDIDHFKKINDTYGHDAGDAILIAFSKLWNEILRIGDFVGRIGGEEFGVFLPETGLKQAEVIAQRLCEKTEEALVNCEAHSLSATVSIGVSVSEHSNDKIKALLKEADVALYEAKNSGRNQVVVASS